MSRSVINLNNVTCVDHAYIDPNGNIVGGSFNPSFLIGGETDPVEKVVVDFSTVKKDVKHAIDDHKNSNAGFDHRLWIIEGYTQAYVEVDGEQVDISGKTKYEIDEKALYSPKVRIDITTPHMVLSLPGDAVRFFKAPNHSVEAIGTVFERYLEEKLTKLYPNIGLFVRCYNTTANHTLTDSANRGSYFTYVHGLKDSTSYGCQNNSHGHLSFIQLFDGDMGNLTTANPDLLLLQNKIASDLDKTIFIRKENIVGKSKTNANIAYTTKRGLFTASYKKDQNKITVLDTETTIEFLADYVAETYADELSSARCTYLTVSEGLSKGAFVQIDYTH